MSDEAREKRIVDAYFRMQAASTQAQRRKAWKDMEAEIKARTPAQVEQMEKEQGLR